MIAPAACLQSRTEQGGRSGLLMQHHRMFAQERTLEALPFKSLMSALGRKLTFAAALYFDFLNSFGRRSGFAPGCPAGCRLEWESAPAPGGGAWSITKP